MKANEVNVEQEIADIKAHMPEVYQAIKDKADEIGKEAYALVRRGLRGEPNCFYAFERGWVRQGRATLYRRWRYSCRANIFNVYCSCSFANQYQPGTGSYCRTKVDRHT